MNFDSRKIESNDVLAIRGTISDGHDFIEKQSCKVRLPLYDTFPENIAKELPMFR
jgi:UDP-N-acetylmuramyl pentapeptide synthase